MNAIHEQLIGVKNNTRYIVPFRCREQIPTLQNTYGTVHWFLIPKNHYFAGIENEDLFDYLMENFECVS